MQRVKVKICGLQEESHVRAAAAAGADFVGLVFAPSSRRVTPERAEQLRQSLRGFEKPPAVVGVFVNESADAVNAIAERCALDFVQLSGDEGIDYCETIVRPVIKTLRVFTATTPDDIMCRIEVFRRTRSPQSVAFLLDTGEGGARGGTGRRFDWRLAREVSAQCPVLVAGGLAPATVGDLVSEVCPYGVDVSSGVERNGSKDPTLIQAFVDAVRRAEQEMHDAENSIAR
jgi:phosphoribosylanthranilate isomerase